MWQLQGGKVKDPNILWMSFMDGPATGSGVNFSAHSAFLVGSNSLYEHSCLRGRRELYGKHAWVLEWNLVHFSSECTAQWEVAQIMSNIGGSQEGFPRKEMWETICVDTVLFVKSESWMWTISDKNDSDVVCVLPSWRILWGSLCVYRGLLYSARNIVKKDPGRGRQNSLGTTGTNFTKPGAHNKGDLCSDSITT